jgi:hypothetical protein
VVLRFLDLADTVIAETCGCGPGDGTPVAVTAALLAFNSNPKLFSAVARTRHAGTLLRELMSRLALQGVRNVRGYLPKSTNNTSNGECTNGATFVL